VGALAAAAEDHGTAQLSLRALPPHCPGRQHRLRRLRPAPAALARDREAGCQSGHATELCSCAVAPLYSCITAQRRRAPRAALPEVLQFLQKLSAFAQHFSHAAPLGAV
jgi:hypothetical protein